MSHDIFKWGFVKPFLDIVVTTYEKCALVDMYAKCDALVKAREFFDIHNTGNVLSWTTLIVGYTQQGQKMYQKGLSSNAIAFICISKVYSGNKGTIDNGKHVHDEIIRQGLFGNDIVLGTTLVDMYDNSGALS